MCVWKRCRRVIQSILLIILIFLFARFGYLPQENRLLEGSTFWMSELDKERERKRTIVRKESTERHKVRALEHISRTAFSLSLSLSLPTRIYGRAPYWLPLIYINIITRNYPQTVCALQTPQSLASDPPQTADTHSPVLHRAVAKRAVVVRFFLLRMQIRLANQ